MSEIFDALLKAQRDVQAKRPPAGESAAETPGQPAPSAPRPRERSSRFAWSRWFARNGHGPGPDASAELLITPDGDGAIAEPFRVLRSTVLGLGNGMLMITSPLDEEGKTFCAANLAISLALASAKDVFLVDLDLRRPSLSTRLGLPSSPGMAECLLGTATWRECLQAAPYPHLRFLPAGRRIKRAPELLASDRLRAILDELRLAAQSHFVVFDTPPVLLTSDPLVLGSQMDHVVLVVRSGSTPRTALSRAVQSVGAERLLGVVFNEATSQPSDYYRYGRRQVYYSRYSGSETSK
jgi:capsular exopolysaccharide synthesis family protein